MAVQDVQLTLNPDATSVALLRSVRDMADRVAFGLRALENYQPSERPTMPTDVIPLLFRDVGQPIRPDDVDQLRAEQRTWLLESGFTGFIRGLSAALQEARLFCILFEAFVGQPATLNDVQALTASTRKSGLKMPIPDLLAEVEKRVGTALELSPHLLSFNKVRNCLEHRHGFVTEVDANDAAKSMLQMIYRRQRVVWVNRLGEEIPLRVPMVVSDGQIVAKVDEATKVFKVGQQVEIGVDEFNDVAFTCFAFALNLAAALPKVP